MQLIGLLVGGPSYCPYNFGRPSRRSLATCLLGPQKLIFQFRGGILPLAPSSAKGYYATVLPSLLSPPLYVQ